MDLDLFSTSVQGYVYKVKFKDTGEFYIGSRYANIRSGTPPEQDFMVKYFTSSKIVEPKIKNSDPTQIEGDIVFKSSDPNELYSIEHGLINDHWDDPLLLNKSNRCGASPQFRTPDQFDKKPCQYCQVDIGANKIITHERGCTSNSNGIKINRGTKPCQYCQVDFGISQHPTHERGCTSNPNGIKLTKPCQYCQVDIGINMHPQHEQGCTSNPNAIKIKYRTKPCQYCHKDIGANKIITHEQGCNSNPNGIKIKHGTKPCQYCQVDFGICQHPQHERGCKSNPNAITPTKPCQYCQVDFGINGHLRHEQGCTSNPNAIKIKYRTKP